MGGRERKTIEELSCGLSKIETDTEREALELLRRKGRSFLLGRQVSLFLVWSFIGVCKKIVHSEQIQTLCFAINVKSYA